VCQNGAVLDLTDSQRAFYTEMRCLSTDAQGNEVLVGLTIEETEFYLQYIRQRRDRNFHNPEARKRYLGLHDKHDIARLAVLYAEIEKRNTDPTEH
jgi:DNA-binding MarR family transcriptional regulator